MANTSESKIEMITVEMKSENVQQAIIAAARREIESSRAYGTIDMTWTPQIISNDYGGYIVYFRKAVAGSAA